MGQFLARAQDRNMTNGDFAFFTFWPQRGILSDKPWISHFTDKRDLHRRKQAYHVVKQVRAYNTQSVKAKLRMLLRQYLPFHIANTVK